MCQHIVQFCSGSTKPLLTVGSFLILLLAAYLGYFACTSQALYRDLDPSVADQRALHYYLQLLGAGYLCLITCLATFAAHYDQKHLIRALFSFTSINFFVAFAAAILFVPSSQELGNLFGERLTEARDLYDFTDRFPSPPANLSGLLPEAAAAASQRQAREASTQAPAAAAEAAAKLRAPPTPAEATKMWDQLQARGCCGLKNATEEWRKALPKSCCADPITEASSNRTSCKQVDEQHNKPCVDVIGATGLNLLIILALIGLVNLYLATVAGTLTYRTFHYNEASQNAYS